ncbi:PilZ domain-containing protein [Candidatus Omnitrophota bacterium]
MQEKRKHSRLKRQFIVSFKEENGTSHFDASQMKDISEGGLRFMTGRPFAKDTILLLKLKTPVAVCKFKIKGKVVESTKIVEGLIYDTRVSFLDIDEDTEAAIRKTIDYFSKKL